MIRTRNTSTLLVAGLVSALSLPACGGDPGPGPKAGNDEPESDGPRRRGGPEPDVSAEIGALDEGAVTQTFQAAMPDMRACLDEGTGRVEFLGGDVAFFVRVDSDGNVAHAHLEKSTLGDRATEKCMLRALSKRGWPKPVGGKNGLARNSLSFESAAPRGAVPWSSDQVSETLETVGSAISECKSGSSGSFTVTAYVGTDGKVMAAGAAPPDEAGEGSVDCIVTVIKDATFPEPGSWPAKVTFQL